MLAWRLASAAAEAAHLLFRLVHGCVPVHQQRFDRLVPARVEFDNAVGKRNGVPLCASRLYCSNDSEYRRRIKALLITRQRIMYR